jgi:hypothetical protein
MITFEQHTEGKPKYYLLNKDLLRQNFVYNTIDQLNDDLILYPNAENGHILDLKKDSYQITTDIERIEGKVRVDNKEIIKLHSK